MGSTIIQCSSSASAVSAGEQGKAHRDLRRGFGRNQPFQPAGDGEAQRRDRDREQPVHRRMRKWLGRWASAFGQKLGVDARHAEKEVQLGRDPRKEEDREGPKAKDVWAVPQRSAQQPDQRDSNQRHLVIGHGAPGAQEPLPFQGLRRAGIGGWGPVITPVRNASSIQPQIASAARKA